MAHFASDSAIPVPAGSALEKSIQDCQSVSEIQNVLHAEAARLRLIERDPLDRSTGETIGDYFSHHVVEPAVAAIANAPHARVLRVNGVPYTIQSDTAEGLDAAELAKMKEIIGTAAPAVTTETEEPLRNVRGQFVTHSPEATALAPTVAAALEAQGISVDELREFSQHRKGEVYQQSWEQATEEFRASPEGADWAGGKNIDVLRDLIIANPDLMNSPSAETLALVWNHMKENHLVVENPELTARDAINKAQTYDEIKQAVGYRDPSSSGLFGR